MTTDSSLSSMDRLRSAGIALQRKACVARDCSRVDVDIEMLLPAVLIVTRPMGFPIPLTTGNRGRAERRTFRRASGPRHAGKIPRSAIHGKGPVPARQPKSGEALV